MIEPPAATGSSARFIGLVREGDQVGARIEYTRPDGEHSTIVFYDTESIVSHIAVLEGEGKDTAEEHAALSAMITEAGKKK